MQLNIAAVIIKIDGLGIINSWVQTMEDDIINKDGDDGEDLDRADNIICIGQPIAMDFKNLAELNKLINNVKYQWDNIGKLMQNF